MRRAFSWMRPFAAIGAIAMTLAVIDGGLLAAEGSAIEATEVAFELPMEASQFIGVGGCSDDDACEPAQFHCCAVDTVCPPSVQDKKPKPTQTEE